MDFICWCWLGTFCLEPGLPWGLLGASKVTPDNVGVTVACSLRKSFLCQGTQSSFRISCPQEGWDTFYVSLCFVVPLLGCSLGILHLCLGQEEAEAQTVYLTHRSCPPPQEPSPSMPRTQEQVEWMPVSTPIILFGTFQISNPSWGAFQPNPLPLS